MRFTTLGAHSETMSFRSKHKHTPCESLPVSGDGSGGNRERGSLSPFVNGRFPPWTDAILLTLMGTTHRQRGENGPFCLSSLSLLQILFYNASLMLGGKRTLRIDSEKKK